MTGGGDPDNRLFNLYFAKYRLYFWAFYILSHRFPFSVLKGFYREKYKNIARQNYRAIGYNTLLNNLNFINYLEITN